LAKNIWQKYNAIRYWVEKLGKIQKTRPGNYYWGKAQRGAVKKKWQTMGHFSQGKKNSAKKLSGGKRGLG